MLHFVLLVSTAVLAHPSLIADRVRQNHSLRHIVNMSGSQPLQLQQRAVLAAVATLCMALMPCGDYRPMISPGHRILIHPTGLIKPAAYYYNALIAEIASTAGATLLPSTACCWHLWCADNLQTATCLATVVLLQCDQHHKLVSIFKHRPPTCLEAV
jgi:hypothetical protein